MGENGRDAFLYSAREKRGAVYLRSSEERAIKEGGPGEKKKRGVGGESFDPMRGKRKGILEKGEEEAISLHQQRGKEHRLYPIERERHEEEGTDGKERKSS